MKIIGSVGTEGVSEVKCDVCSRSTRLDCGGLQFGTLQARWGFGTQHNGEHYEIHLCEGCFFGTTAYLRKERQLQNLFAETDEFATPYDFGLVHGNDIAGEPDSGS